MGNNLGLASLNLQTEYRTGSSDPIKGLYEPCLLQSVLYKRAVGYFRSSVYLVAGSAIIEFAQRGGKIQLICSPELDENDVKSIVAGYSERPEINPALLISEIERLLSDPSTKYQTRVLATLVAVGALDIKIAMRPAQQGLYHEKIGVFIDEYYNRVSFIGSANESWSGWHPNGNFESIEVFCSWQHRIENERSARHEANFDNLWLGSTKDVQTVAFPDAVLDHLCGKAYQSLDDAKKDFQFSLQQPEAVLVKRSPLPHQLNAIAAWREQGSRGIFEHATGSGKTFTALEAARNHLENGLPVLILVPSTLLLQQWNEEVKAEYPDSVIVLAGAGNDHWKRPGKLRGLSAQHATGPRVIIAMMQTAAKENFRQLLYQGPHLMMIADEVHQIGSPNNSQCLQIDTGDRLGLSATPKRYGDVEGTSKIFDYFGDIVPPPITLADAVKSGRLVEYEYFPHAIKLTAEEADEWK
ncbi:MAG: DEAD/DEAH box helicase family protein, partial [Anaerolineaceae bacterium]